MANAGDPPALPDTEDPYELLGVARDADATTVKKAYARLVRIFRPDKSPREFQRVHAAFEIARVHGDAPLPVAPRRDVADDKPQIDQKDLQQRISARAAAAGDDLARRCAVVDELLAERAPLDLVFANQALADAISRHRQLTWSRIAATGAPLDVTIGTWMANWRHAFEHDHDRAAALLDDDRLRRDAADEPHVAAMCLDCIAALRWVHTFDEKRLVSLFRETCSANPQIGHMFDTLALDFAGATAIRMHAWPEPFQLFKQLAIATRLDGPLRCAELGRELRAELTADLDATWATFEAITRDRDLQPFYEIIYQALPPAYLRLDELPKERFAQLTDALSEAGAAPWTWKVRGGVAAGAAALAVFGWIPSALLVGGAVTYGLATETRRYRTQIRPRLAKVILDVPVVSSVVHRWIILNGKLAGRLTRYTPGVDNDSALYLFSMLVAYADALA